MDLACDTSPHFPRTLRSFERLARRSSSVSLSARRDGKKTLSRDSSEPILRKRKRCLMGSGHFDENPFVTLSSRSTSSNISEDFGSNENFNIAVDQSFEPCFSEEKVQEIEYNRGRLIEHLFRDVVPIEFEFAGNNLHIIGNTHIANRITRKFTIMQKLAHLIGCGLDCHFRMAHNEYRLMMLVRGAPRALFGATVVVIPDVTNIRKLATPGEFVEAGQAIFFNTVLDLIPRNLEAIQRVLQSSLTEGHEDEAIRKFYGFLKTIRQSIMDHISTIPVVWTIEDFPSKNEVCIDLSAVRKVIKECGDKHLLKLENEQPGYTNHWCTDLGLRPVQTFSQMMEDKFEAFEKN